MAEQNVLIITYYWPPAGGPGVQRWLKFVQYLPEFEITPTVYCPENPTYPIIDESLRSEIPQDIKVVKYPINEPYKIARYFSKKSTTKISSGVIPDQKKQSVLERFMLFVRGNLFIPDARKKWVKPSVKFLSKYIEEHKIRTIITTGPPHSLHLIGHDLKSQLNINWVADFRDPWTTIGYHKSLKLLKPSEKKHKKLENAVLNAADKIIVTSHNTKLEFKTKTKTPITVITNGYDNYPSNPVEKDSKFTISHIGSLLSDRNPKILWNVLAELVAENDDFALNFQLNLVGVVSDTIIDAIKLSGLADYLNIVGYVSHNKAIDYQRKSQILLLIEINSEDTKAIIPGKLFEYMASKTPILAIGPEDSDIKKIITSTNTGSYILYSEKEKLKNEILNSFMLYKEERLASTPTNLKKYSRKALTQQLSLLLKEF